MRQGETTDNYEVVSAQTDGLVVYNLFLLQGKSVLHFSKLDTALQEVWNGNIELPFQVSAPRSLVRKGVLFMISRNAGKSDFTLVQLDLVSKKYSTYTVPNYLPFTPTEFTSVGDAVMIGGQWNNRPLVLHYSITSNQTKILPGIYNTTGELLQLREGQDRIIEVVASGKNPARRKSLWVYRFDAGGTLLQSHRIEPDQDKTLIFGRSVKTDGDDQIIAGVYGKNEYYARGLFVARVRAAGGDSVRYYNFADLHNFFNYMKPSRQRRVKDRIERRRVKGKKVRFNYRFMVDELIPYGDDYIMLGEAFFPTYRSNGNSFSNLSTFMGRSSRADYIFDGYQYTHAVVIGFSKTGALLWDNSFEINDVKTFQLQQYVKIQPEATHINLMYVHNNLIRTKVIRNNDVLEGRTTEHIRTNFSTDVTTSDFNGRNRLEYWYPGHFYVIGSQHILNATQSGTPLSRKVFYINKIIDR